MSDAPAEVKHKRLLLAAWLWTGAAPARRDAGIVTQGERVLATGDASTLRRDHPDAELTDLGAVILIPGLVNPHAHLELTHHAQGERPASFVEWILRLRRRVENETDLPAASLQAMRDGIAESLRFGVTTIGDITNFPLLQRTRLGDLPARLVSFGEVRGMAARRGLASAMIDVAAERHGAVRIALSPHAPYSVERDVYRACIDLARQRRLPLMTHLAELPYEAEFLAGHSGPLRELWGHLGGWDTHVPPFTGGPIRFASAIGLLDGPTLLAHVNYCDDDELDLLAAGKASVVYCPRTHAYFGHPPHRWREMLARGINVVVGTDSRASSPDLNLLDDLRALRRLAPDLPPDQLFAMATTRAARALRWDDEVGSLMPGKFADLAVFDVATGNPLMELLDGQHRPREVWVGGMRV